MGIDKSLKGYDGKAFRPQALVILDDVRGSCLAQKKIFLKNTSARVWESRPSAGEEVV